MQQDAFALDLTNVVSIFVTPAIKEDWMKTRMTQKTTRDNCAMVENGQKKRSFIFVNKSNCSTIFRALHNYKHSYSTI